MLTTSTRYVLSIVMLSVLAMACTEEPIDQDYTVLNKRMYRYLDKGAKLDTLASGYEWSEGPVWSEKHEMLLWSDVPTNTVYRWTKEQGTTRYLYPSGHTGTGNREGSNGLIVNADGQLVLCQHGDRAVVIMQAPLDAPVPRYKPITAYYRTGRYNSPNDVIQDRAGAYYFTDPPYGLEGLEDDPQRQLDFQGIFKVKPDGTENSFLLDASLSRPNGLALSPDESTLYVANSDPSNAIWMKYTLSVSKDTIIDQSVLMDATSMVSDHKGLPDGLKVKSDGTIFATGPGGVLVLAPDGTHLGTIGTGQATSNCAFNADETVLYITADSYVFSIDLIDSKK